MSIGVGICSFFGGGHKTVPNQNGALTIKLDRQTWSATERTLEAAKLIKKGKSMPLGNRYRARYASIPAAIA